MLFGAGPLEAVLGPRDILQRGQAEKALIVTGKVLFTDVPHLKACGSSLHMLIEHEALGLLQPQLLYVLERRKRCGSFEVAVKGGHSHGAR